MTADKGQHPSAQPSFWSIENEIHLFDALTGYKPTGVNKHFQMLVILERFCSRAKKDVPATAIWERLNQLYDMNALDAMETTPFPNTESEFDLPADEFEGLMQEKVKVGNSSGPPPTAASQREEEPRTPTDRRSRAREERGGSNTRERRKNEASDSLRRAPKRGATARDSGGKSESPVTPLKRTRRN